MTRKPPAISMSVAALWALIPVFPGVCHAELLFQITDFADPPWSLEYPNGFTGTVGETAIWPAEMGWQGDQIDIEFALDADIPSEAVHYRFRMVIPEHFDQSFDLTVQAGPSLDDLVEVHREFTDTARVFAATIPLDRFTPGQTNWIRIQGIDVEVGGGAPAGIQWSRWTLSRTEPSGSLDEVRLGQLQRGIYYVQDAIAPTGLVRDSLTLDPKDDPFHPATPDAAGFALLALSAADHLDLITFAEPLVQDILSAYSGHTEDVMPDRTVEGHWVHFMNVEDGQYARDDWDDTYSPIGSALLIHGALFAKNHFIDNTAIAAYADELFSTTDFNACIHPSLDGRIYLGMKPEGGGYPGEVKPWNEYMLVVSAALRQPDNSRAEAVDHFWLDTIDIPISTYRDIPTLTDNPGQFAPAFWVQQGHFFNTDFASNSDFETYFRNHQRADALYCAADENPLQLYRYGLSAGVSPTGYTVDRIYNNVNVFSPEAVTAWSDLDTMLEFEEDQPASSDPRFRYGLTRVSADDPDWIPYDAGLVDHLFLMFGLVESINPLFFRQRQPFQADVDTDGLADAYENCPATWNPHQDDSDGDGLGDACDCGTPFADADADADVDMHDFAVWQLCPTSDDETPEHCLYFDRNADHQIDAHDLPDFTACLESSGPNTPADPTCGD